MYNITLPRLAFVITTHCNLKCKYCSVGIPNQKEPYNMCFDEFKQGLDNAFEIVDTIGSLEFGGGEPFLHADLSRMIESFSQYKDRFNQWLIVTNGTILINDKLIKTIKRFKDNGVIHVSDYNIYPEKTKQFIQTLDEIGIKYRVDKYYGENQYQGGWVDPGEIVSRNRNAEQLQRLYSNCGLVQNGGCWRIYKGKIHLCARSCRCLDAGFDFPTDYVDLFGEAGIEKKAEKLRSIVNAPYIKACDYCNGDLGTKDKSKRISAGEQI
jgi:hypothetical protein